MESRGLKKISRKKTSLQGQKVKIVATFKHLNSAVTVGGWGGGGGGGDGMSRPGWHTWKLNGKLKVRVHKTVVRLVLIYGPDTWTVKKTRDKKL